jgi:TonB-dependent receptor
MISNQARPNRKFTGIAVGVALAIAGVSNAQEQNTQTESVDPSVEVIEVTGVRGALEDALAVKRNASSIVDHLSAEDIGQLPALDLGDALQTIPGIQLNADGNDRASTINLRGLPGGFVFDMTNGLPFAATGLSTAAQGVSNPFGAFEAAIFRGATVVKAPTADLPAGGIAGFIDKKLPRALDARRDSVQLNLGARYEDLSGNVDPEFSIRADKKLIEDKLAVSATFARSKQRFRRDSINTTRFEALTDGHLRTSDFNPNGEGQPTGALDAYVESLRDQGVFREGDVDPLIQFPSELRQFSEQSDGSRQSYAVNVEWKPFENFKAGLDFIGTRRELNNNQQDVFILGFRQFAGGGVNRQATVNITPTSTPIFGFEDGPDGRPVYVLTGFDFDNAQFFPGNRDRDSLEETNGVTLNLDWYNDDWTISSKLHTSSSESSRINAQFDARFNPINNSGGGRRPANNNRERTNGIEGSFFSGNGNIEDLAVGLLGFDRLTLGDNPGDIQFNQPFRNSGANGGLGRNDSNDDTIHEQINRQLDVTSVNAASVDPDNPNLRSDTRFLVTGAETFHFRDVDTFRIDFERNLYIGPLTSVKFGYYKSRETFERDNNRHSPAFIDTSNISNALFRGPISSSGAEFFEGDTPGTVNENNGFVALDVDRVVDAVSPGVQDRLNSAIEELRAAPVAPDGETPTTPNVLTADERDQIINTLENLELTSLGFLPRIRPGDILSEYSSEVDINEAYIQANFDGDLGSKPFSGNIGFRYVETTNSSTGLELVSAGRNGLTLLNEYGEVTTSTTFSDVLPSVNFKVDLTDNIELRSAYYEGIVRLNAGALSPADVILESPASTRFSFEQSLTNLNTAFSADSFDLSLSWYNREGSVFSLGYFRKDIQQAERTQICPTGFDENGIANAAPFGIGEVFIDGQENLCLERAVTQRTIQNADGSFENIEVNRTVDIEVASVADEVSTIEGLELIVQQNFDFLPGFWQYFGGQFNASFVDNTSGLPLPGISDFSYNAILFYETPKFNTRILYNFRDDFLLQSIGSFNGTIDRQVASRARLDFQLGYRFTNKLRVTFRAFNILNTRFEEFQSNNPALLRRVNHDGRTYSLQANYRF